MKSPSTGAPLQKYTVLPIEERDERMIWLLLTVSDRSRMTKRDMKCRTGCVPHSDNLERTPWRTVCSIQSSYLLSTTPSRMSSDTSLSELKVQVGSALTREKHTERVSAAPSDTSTPHICRMNEKTLQRRAVSTPYPCVASRNNDTTHETTCLILSQSTGQT